MTKMCGGVDDTECEGLHGDAVRGDTGDAAGDGAEHRESDRPNAAACGEIFSIDLAAGAVTALGGRRGLFMNPVCTLCDEARPNVLFRATVSDAL